MRKEFAVHLHTEYFLSEDGMKSRIEPRNIEVMVRVKGYAMVRRKGCMPYVVAEKDIHPLPKPGEA